MQGESTGARAGAIAGDQFTFGKPRTLDERREELERVTHAMVNDYVASHRIEKVTIATIGAEPLTVGETPAADAEE